MHDEREDVRLRMLLDASVLEVFANRRLVLAARVYPASPASIGGCAFVDGAADVTRDV